MNDIQSYERLIKKRTEGKMLFTKLALILGYILFAVVGILLVVSFVGGNATLILLVAALDLCFFLVTRKLLRVEFEYTFISGTFYLAKIYGKSARKEIFESELSRLSTVAPYSGQYKADAERQSPEKIFWAVSSKKAEDIWFMLFESEGGTKTMIIFEADERSLKCLRLGRPRAVAREKLTSTKKMTKEKNDA